MPFIFPAMVPMRMFPVALVCGNCFILKPSERDPSTSVTLAELLKQAGLPDGVFQVVHCDKVAVDSILEHSDIAAVSFVGSMPIARYWRDAARGLSAGDSGHCRQHRYRVAIGVAAQIRRIGREHLA